MSISQVQLANDPFRAAVERLVSAHTGRHWTIHEARDMGDFACHPAAILSDGTYSVFAKFSAAANGAEQFQVELDGLQLLADQSGVAIPTPIGMDGVSGGSILVMEGVPAVERESRHWRQIGETLARIHLVKAERFGLERNGYFGPLPQDNTPQDDWPTFYAEQRLHPMLRLAVDSGNLPTALAAQVERLIAHLPALCGSEVRPTLLHGDAQKNNFISTAAGTVVIDPAVYYGHPEMDLAYIDYFEAVPQDVFDGYREVLPIDAGFGERRGLWRAWGYLAAVTVEGGRYVDWLAEALQKYN